MFIYLTSVLFVCVLLCPIVCVARDCQSHGDVHHVQEGRRGGGLSSIGSLRATSQGTGIPPQPLPQSSCLIAMATNGTTSDNVH